MVCCVIHAVVQFAMFCLDLSITHGILCHFFSRNDYLVMYQQPYLAFSAFGYCGSASLFARSVLLKDFGCFYKAFWCI
jgi:hypothetical protein